MMEHQSLLDMGESSMPEGVYQGLRSAATMASKTIHRALSYTDSTDKPINEPITRMWELNENSTHYDRMVAAPSDEDLVKFWSGWAGIMLTTGLLTTFILIPLVCSRTSKVRQNPFNLYLIFLMFPDMLIAWLCGLTCLTNAIEGHFTSAFMCRFQSFYMVAYIGANAWLNLVVTRHLYRMLNAARLFQRYELPNRRQVFKEVAIVYIYAMVLAALGVLPTASWWPHKTRMTIGAACIPMDYDAASTAVFYGIFFPLLFGIPLVYVCWAGYQIYKHNMLPPSGRRRILTVYFFRLAAVFVIMWLPGLLLLFVTSAWLNPWVQWAGGAWSHMQGLVSAIISLWKPDIRKAVVDFWCCQTDIRDTWEDSDNSNNNKPSIVSKKPWANSSVYWSPRIGLGRSKQSRVSSYREGEEVDIESPGANPTSDFQSDFLVSDDSCIPEEEEVTEFPVGKDFKDTKGLSPLNKSDRQTTEETMLTSDVEQQHDKLVESKRTKATEVTAESSVSHRSRHSSPREEEKDPNAPIGALYIVPDEQPSLEEITENLS